MALRSSSSSSSGPTWTLLAAVTVLGILLAQPQRGVGARTPDSDGGADGRLRLGPLPRTADEARDAWSHSGRERVAIDPDSQFGMQLARDLMFNDNNNNNNNNNNHNNEADDATLAAMAMLEQWRLADAEPLLRERLLEAGLLQRPWAPETSAEDEPEDGQRIMEKRACIRRGGHCDHRSKKCCDHSSCRCNLWGSNCRCQRMGFFQKWG